MIRRFDALLFATVVLTPGCGASTRDVEVRAMESKAVIYSGFGGEHTVVVTVSSPDTPIDVYLCLEQDHEAVQGQMERHEKPTRALDGRTNVQEATLEGLVPAGKEYAVVLFSRGYPKDTKVKVKTSKK